jgi:ABC-type lipoprotein export system ATPase subunit
MGRPPHTAGTRAKYLRRRAPLTALKVENLILDIPGRRLLDNVSFELQAGETLVIMGPSGCGKTSLINCISGISTPTSGRIWIQGQEITFANPYRRAAIRLANIGYIFQFGELLPELTVIENVALPLRLRGMPRRDAEEAALDQLASVGLADRRTANPEVLSGGEVQRVAVARAMATNPPLVLADEPTGSLDEDNTQRVVDLIFALAARSRAAVVVGTHNPRVADLAGRVALLSDGKLVPMPGLALQR